MSLTEKYVLSRTKAPSLAEVRRLNVWGSEIHSVCLLLSRSLPLRFCLASLPVDGS